MKTPIPPPSRSSLLRTTAPLATLLSEPALGRDPDYHPWEWFVRHEPPAGFSREDWWLAVRLRREQSARPTPLALRDGTPLTYNLPDPLLRLIEQVSTRARGEIALPEPIANPATRNRYLISSLSEEAITSSQLEGASTSRVRAKEMLREGRRPQDRSEQMILNNYEAMQEIIALKDEPLSPGLIREIHRRVTTGTLDDPSGAGRIQRPGDERVRIYGTQDQDRILHVPPPAEELPERMAALCAFANSTAADEGPYMPPLLRAITLHFMMGYDHYFADGNGRTSRAIFYWSMLHQGFFLTEFLSISRLLAHAPAQYARSFLLTEDDDGDLTAVWDGDFFSYLLRGDNNEILNVLGYIKEDIPMTRLDEARFALDEWHRDHLWPTAFWRENDDAGLTFSIGAAVAIDWEHGVTDKQIYLQLDCAMSTILKCFDDVRSRLGMEQPS